MTTQQETVPLDEFFEAEGGARHFRAVTFQQLRVAVEAALEELTYDPDAPQDVMAALKVLDAHEFRI